MQRIQHNNIAVTVGSGMEHLHMFGNHCSLQTVKLLATADQEFDHQSIADRLTETNLGDIWKEKKLATHW